MDVGCDSNATGRGGFSVSGLRLRDAMWAAVSGRKGAVSSRFGERRRAGREEWEKGVTRWTKTDRMKRRGRKKFHRCQKESLKLLF